MRRAISMRAIGAVIVVIFAAAAEGQQTSARAVLEQAAAAMGGLERLQGLDNVVLTGFGEYLNQSGGGNPSPDPRAPAKLTVAHDVERVFDLANERAVNRARARLVVSVRDRTALGSQAQVQTGVAMLDHPLPALLEALDPETRLGPVHAEDGRTVVEFTIQQGATLWLALDPTTKLPAWVRWISPSTTLGDVVQHGLLHGVLTIR